MSPDQRQVPNTSAALEIAGQGDRLPQIKLLAQRRKHASWDCVAGIREHAKKAGAAKHQRKAKTIMVAAQALDDPPINLIQMKIPGELLRRRIAVKAAKVLPLGFGQVACWHFVRNLGHLRGQQRTRRNKALNVAKIMSEIELFCNMFRIGNGAGA